jgi:hypothetical protein
VADPVETLRRLYAHFNLGSFEAAEPRVRDVVARRSSYKTNRFKELGESLGGEISRRWGAVIDAQGYSRRGFGG